LQTHSLVHCQHASIISKINNAVIFLHSTSTTLRLLTFIMGACLGCAQKMGKRSKNKKVLLVGLDGAGKTTILYKLTLDEIVSTIPTVGLNIESIEYRDLEFQCWDLGGQKKIRDIWPQYYPGTDAIIFVIDSNEPKRLLEVKEELWTLLKEPKLSNCAILLMANKQDLPNSVNISEIATNLDLQSIPNNRKWMIQETCAMSGEGLYEGIHWLSVDTKKNRLSHISKTIINTERYNQL